MAWMALLKPSAIALEMGSALFRGLRDAYTWIKTVLGETARLHRAVKQGGVDPEIHALIRKSLGLDLAHAHAEGTAKEVGGLLQGKLANPGFDPPVEVPRTAMEQRMLDALDPDGPGFSVARPAFSAAYEADFLKRKKAWLEAGADPKEGKAIVEHYYRKEAFSGLSRDAVLLVPVPSTGGENSLPWLLAERIAEDFGQEVVTEPVAIPTARQPAKEKVTFLEKMRDPVAFKKGEGLEDMRAKGKAVVVVEDVHNTGESWMALRDFLVREGIKVEGSAALLATKEATLAQRGSMDALTERLHRLTGESLAEISQDVYGFFDGQFQALLAKANTDATDRGRASEVLAFIRSEPRGDRATQGDIRSLNEAMRRISEAGTGGAGGYSVAPVARLQQLESRLKATLSADPDARRAVLGESVRKLQDLEFNWSSTRWTGQGDEIKPLSERKSVGELDQEEKQRRMAREDELTGPIYHRYEQALNDTERAKLYSHPLLDFLLSKPKPGSPFRQGKIMPYSYAVEHGYLKNGGEYDARDNVPSMFFKGRQRIDDVAREAHEAMPEYLKDGEPRGG